MKNSLKQNSVCDVRLYDWIVLSFFAAACAVLFTQNDIVVTAEHSFTYLRGNFTDFYEACFRLNGHYAANYMPSTFLAFAIWNLPVFLLGGTPIGWQTSSFPLILWYKLLPALVFVYSALILYKICRRCFGFSNGKAKLAMYLFLSAPLAFFSQFIFSQYDIFTVCCMLLGMYFYFAPNYGKKQHLLFLLFFGLAVTFKYQSALILAVLLLLRVKHLGRLLLSAGLAALPFLVEFGFYFLSDRSAFTKGVLSFSALDYVKNAEIAVGFASIQLLPVLLLGLFAWAYFIKPKDRRGELAYALFFCCGICFVLFSFMTWHPQWLIFAVPFFVLSLMINRYFDVFLCLDIIFIVPFYVFVVNLFTNHVDQDMLRNMVFASWLKCADTSEVIKMKDIFRFSDTNLLFSILVAILLICFIFKHPRFCAKNFAEDWKCREQAAGLLPFMHVVRARFIAGVLCFIIPALLCLPSMLAAPKILWRMMDDNLTNVSALALEKKTAVLKQTATFAGTDLQAVKCKIATYGVTKPRVMLNLEVRDPKTGRVLASGQATGEALEDNLYTKFDLGHMLLDKGKQYDFVFTADSAGSDEVVALYRGDAVADYYAAGAVQQDYTADTLSVNDVVLDGVYLQMMLIGE